MLVHGARPLVILSLTTLDIGSTLDVASHNSQRGPGSDPADCTNTAPTGTGGGGAGGTFGGKGGGGPNLADGVPQSVIVPTALRGGCPGGTGKDFDFLAEVGHGGGAVTLIAQSISVLGSINASGERAGGNTVHNGGNGGGAGGMIVFDAPALTVGSSTHIYANGGGGGGGGASTIGPGFPGSDPASENSGGTGGGGGAGTGGDGGAGATLDGMGNMLDALDGRSGTSGGGDGGGGGGFGVIQILHATGVDTTHMSPKP
jgi:hypothetical protein